jgi:hypothetical protein
MARGQTRDDDHVALLVDRLLARPKRLQGVPAWREGNPGDMRIRWPLLIGSSVSEDAALRLTAFPNSAELRFTIAFVFRASIARLDFVPDHEGHTNPLNRAALLDSYRLRGPHYHSWADNRHLATAAALPRELKCARALPPQIRRWEQAFRWFCGEVGISLDDGNIIELPARTRLL